MNTSLKTRFRFGLLLGGLLLGGLVIGALGPALASGQGSNALEILRHSIDSGAGVASGGVLQLRGSIGQPDAGYAAGGLLELEGGFWTREETAIWPDAVFASGFEDEE